MTTFRPEPSIGDPAMTATPTPVYILTPYITAEEDFQKIRTQLEDYAKLLGLEPVRYLSQTATSGGKLWIVQHDNGNETVEMTAARSYYLAHLRSGTVPHIEAATTAGWRLEITLANKVMARKMEEEVPMIAGDTIPKAAFIRGLLQPGSAVYVGDRPARVLELARQEGTDFVIVARGFTVSAIGMDTPAAREISLALTDETSCAHAAWWVGEGLRGITIDELRLLALCRCGLRLNLDQQRMLQELVLRKAAERAAMTAEVEVGP